MKPTPADHALAVAKAALNFVPVVGGLIASLISDYVLRRGKGPSKLLRSGWQKRSARSRGGLTLSHQPGRVRRALQQV